MTTAGRSIARALLCGALLGAPLLPAPPAEAQGKPADIFRVEWSREAVPRGGWAVEGYVTNDSRYRVGGVRLRVEVLDEAGSVIGESFGWVYGNVAAGGGRAYYAVSVPRRGADYRVTVVSYSPIALDAP